MLGVSGVNVNDVTRSSPGADGAADPDCWLDGAARTEKPLPWVKRRISSIKKLVMRQGLLLNCVRILISIGFFK